MYKVAVLPTKNVKYFLFVSDKITSAVPCDGTLTESRMIDFLRAKTLLQHDKKNSHYYY